MPGDTIARDEPTYHLRTEPRRSGRASALAFGALLVAAGVWFMYETRGTTLWVDEWQWATEYRNNSVGDFLTPHNGHPTLVPVLIYRLLFATVGIAHSAPYRAVGIAGHLLCVALLYWYVARRASLGWALGRRRADPVPRAGLAEHPVAAADRLAARDRRRPRRAAAARPSRPLRRHRRLCGARDRRVRVRPRRGDRSGSDRGGLAYARMEVAVDRRRAARPVRALVGRLPGQQQRPS